MRNFGTNQLSALAVLLLVLGILLFKEGAYLHDLLLVAGIIAGLGSLISALKEKEKAGNAK